MNQILSCNEDTHVVTSVTILIHDSCASFSTTVLFDVELVGDFNDRIARPCLRDPLQCCIRRDNPRQEDEPFQGLLHWRLYHRPVDRHRDHVDVQLLAGRLIDDLAVVDGIVRRRSEQVIRRRRGLRNSGCVYRLGTLRVGYCQRTTTPSTAPLGAADDEEERHQAAKRADVPDYRPRIQWVLQLVVDYNKMGTCERGAR